MGLNKNMLIDPQLAALLQEELKTKLDAQIAALQEEQCRMAYEMLMREAMSMLMREAMSLRSQLARCSVANTDSDEDERLDKAYVDIMFGAMDKCEQPLSDITKEAFDGVRHDLGLGST